MSGYQCEECQDTGWKLVTENGVDTAVKCKCYEIRMNRLRMEHSGISRELQSKGFNDFECRGMQELERAKKKAIMYYQSFPQKENSRHNSIMFCGRAGAGKTHLGMAVCNNLLGKLNVGVIYMAYRNAITEIKQMVTDRECYFSATESYRKARVLYIDDLLKGRSTDADLNILYDLINYRYMHHMPLVISTEKMPDELLAFDEAVGSRIVEMCRGNIVILKGKELNYRLYS